jgi:serine/threonine-protein kinase
MVAEIEEHVGQPAVAERHYVEAALAAEAGHDDRLVAEARTRLAWLVGSVEDRPDEGGKLVREAEAAIERVGASDDLRAELLNAESAIADGTGHHDEAVALAERQVAILERIVPRDAIELGAAENNLGTLLLATQSYASGLTHLDRALALETPLLGAHHPIVLRARFNQALAMAGSRPKAEALEVARQLVEDAEIAYGADGLDLADPLELYGMALAELPERRAEAPRPLERAVAILGAKLPPDHEHLVNMRAELGEVLIDCGRFGDALPHLDAFVASATTRPGADNQRLRQALVLRAQALLGLHRVSEARVAMERAVALRVPRPDDDPRNVAIEDFTLARALSETGELARARELARSAEAGFLAHPIDDDERLAAVRAWLHDH